MEFRLIFDGPLKAAAGIDDKHALRKAFHDQFKILWQQVPLSDVKEQLGHSSIQMTVDIYGHLIPNSNREAVNRLDNPHSNAPHPHPPKTEKPQPSEIAANS